MKVRGLIYSTVAALALTGFMAAPASALTIGFDQTGNNQQGKLSYAGGDNPLVGTNISFNSIGLVNDPIPDLVCHDCKLSFTTGNKTSTDGDDSATFGPDGSFTITGTASKSDGTVVSLGPLVFNGLFTGNSTIKRNPNDTSSPFDATFTAFGTDDKAQGILDYFNIDPTADFSFTNSELTADGLVFRGDGFSDGFDADVTNADLANSTDAGFQVPEPQELGIFGLGLALIVGSLLYRRKNGADIG